MTANRLMSARDYNTCEVDGDREPTILQLHSKKKTDKISSTSLNIPHLYLFYCPFSNSFYQLNCVYNAVYHVERLLLSPSTYKSDYWTFFYRRVAVIWESYLS